MQRETKTLLSPHIAKSIIRYDSLNESEKSLYNQLLDFYANTPYIEDILIPLNNESHPLSLRLINWVVTNFVRVQGVRYCVNDKVFDIHANYQSQLTHWKKSLFDPFRRNNRIRWKIGEEQFMITTLSQLNFFRWCIEYKLLDFILEHKQAIENQMKLHEKPKHNKSNWPCRLNVPISISIISNASQSN